MPALPAPGVIAKFGHCRLLQMGDEVKALVTELTSQSLENLNLVGLQGVVVTSGQSDICELLDLSHGFQVKTRIRSKLG